MAALIGGLGPAIAASVHSARRALKDMRHQLENDEASTRRQRRLHRHRQEASNGGHLTPSSHPSPTSTSPSYARPHDRYEDSFGTGFDGRLPSNDVILDLESNHSPSSSSSGSSRNHSAPKWGYTPPPPPIRRILNELKPLPNEPPPVPITRMKEAPSSPSTPGSNGASGSSRRSPGTGSEVEFNIPEAPPPYNSWLDRHRRRAPTQKDLLDELGLGSDDDDDDEGKQGQGLYSYLFGVPW